MFLRFYIYIEFKAHFLSLHPPPIEFHLKIKYTMIYESIYPPEINFGSFMEERTSICIS